MLTNREWAAAFGVLHVAWMLLGYATEFLAGYPTIIWEGVVNTLLVLIFTPLVMSKARWTALGATIAGVISAIAHILGLVTLPMSKAYGPIISIVLALLFAYFSYRAYEQNQ
jgi:hypothetical protein